jgi:SAM-dependent methyltransferase
MATDPGRRWAQGLRGAPGDVLAALAGNLGVPWDGPAATTQVELGDVPGRPPWELLDLVREETLAAGERRRLGAHHTPPDLARRLVELALDGVSVGATVLDPACGGGAFLVAAARHRPDVRLVGVDLDPLAVATTRAALHAAGAADRSAVDVADGLAHLAGVPATAVDVVVGNPPFLSPLGAGNPGTAAAVDRRVALGSPYLDVAALFLLAAVEAAPRVVLLQPESLLSSRDARPVRSAITERLDGIWVAGEPVFDAAVRVCAPVVGAGGSRTVLRWRGRAVRPAPAAARPTAASWAALRPTSAPSVRVAKGAPRLRDLATATAGFRDEFYGIAAAVAEGGGGAPVVTSGLVDPGLVRWGERAARIGGRSFAAPTVEPAHLGPRLEAWVRARLVPKVLVATQTRVLEAAADPGGRFVPLTPVLAVAPHDPADTWRVAAALTSPLVSAWALRTYGGAALSGDAVKLSAAQVLDAPLPSDDESWAAAVAALRGGDVDGCALALAAGDDRLLGWWRARLPAARTV